MSESQGERVWRVRMKYSPTERDFSFEAWKRGEVGIWYGAWSVEDFRKARETSKEQESLEGYLNRVPAQEELGDKAKIDRRGMQTISRFFGHSEGDAKHDALRENDWVVVICTDESRTKTINLGRVKGDPKDSQNHELNTGPKGSRFKERWKYREIVDQKSFAISSLPDFYRLIPQYGRQGNVFQFRKNYLDAINILIKCRDVSDVQEEYEAMDDYRRLDLMGPIIWEALCLGYLIRMKNFVPTGVSVGGTLESFDMVGSDWQSGAKIYAQCKKDEDSKDIEENFYVAAQDVKRVRSDATVLYFPYGGCAKTPPPGVVDEIVDRETIKDWFRTADGARYLKMFFGCYRGKPLDQDCL